MGGQEKQSTEDTTAISRLKRELERKSEALVKAERAKTLLKKKVDELAKKNSCLRDEFQATFDGLNAEKTRLSLRIEEQREAINDLLKVEPLKIKKVLKYVKYFMETDEDKNLDIKKLVEESELFRKQLAEKGKVLVNESFSPGKYGENVATGTKEKNSDASKAICAFQILLERYIKQSEAKDRMIAALKAEADEVPDKNLEIWNLNYKLQEAVAKLTTASSLNLCFETKVNHQKEKVKEAQILRSIQDKRIKSLQMKLIDLSNKEVRYRQRVESSNRRRNQSLNGSQAVNELQVNDNLQDVENRTVELIELYAHISDTNKRMMTRVRRLENFCTIGNDDDAPTISKDASGKPKSFFDRFRRKKGTF